MPFLLESWGLARCVLTGVLFEEPPFSLMEIRLTRALHDLTASFPLAIIPHRSLTKNSVNTHLPLLLGIGSIKPPNPRYQAWVVPRPWGAQQVLWGLTADQKPLTLASEDVQGPSWGGLSVDSSSNVPFAQKSVAMPLLMERPLLPCGPQAEQLETSHDLSVENSLSSARILVRVFLLCHWIEWMGVEGVGLEGERPGLATRT